MIIDLNVKPKTIKLLEENIREKLCDLGLGKNFFDMTPKAQPIKKLIDKLDLVKIFKILLFERHC